VERRSASYSRLFDLGLCLFPDIGVFGSSACSPQQSRSFDAVLLTGSSGLEMQVFGRLNQGSREPRRFFAPMTLVMVDRPGRVEAVGDPMSGVRATIATGCCTEKRSQWR